MSKGQKAEQLGGNKLNQILDQNQQELQLLHLKRKKMSMGGMV